MSRSYGRSLTIKRIAVARRDHDATKADARCSVLGHDVEYFRGVGTNVARGRRPKLRRRHAGRTERRGANDERLAGWLRWQRIGCRLSLIAPRPRAAMAGLHGFLQREGRPARGVTSGRSCRPGDACPCARTPQRVRLDGCFIFFDCVGGALSREPITRRTLLGCCFEHKAEPPTSLR